MSKPVINETIVADDPTKVTGQFRLYAQTGGGGVAYTNAGTPLTIGQVIRISFDSSGALKADDGITALQLNPNSGSSSDAIVSPSGTTWEYEVRYPNTPLPIVRYLTVTDVAGPLNVSSILTTAPASLPTSAVPIAGGTMTGPLVIAADNGLRIPTIADATKYVVEFLRTLSDSTPVFTFRDPGPVTPNTNDTFWQVLDSVAGSQITGINRDGGQFWTDGLSFLRGGAIHANTAYWPQIRFCFLDQANKRAPALVFDYIGTGGSTVTNLGDTITIDAGKDTWIRHTDDDFLQASKATRFGTSSVTTIGPAGPGSEPGVSMSNNLGTGTIFAYRRTANVLRLVASAGVEMQGPVLGATDNTYDVGSTSLRFKDVYFAGRLLKGTTALGLIDSGQPAATVSNSTAETTVLTSTITSAAAGNHYKLRVYGSLTNSSGLAVTYQTKVKLGAATLITSDLISIATGTFTKQWDLDMDLWCYTDTAHQDARMRWLITNGSSNNAPNFPTGSQGGAIGGGLGTVDMTTNPALVVTMTMGTASSSANFVVSSWYLERLS